MLEPYVTDLKEATKENEFFRKVLFTGTKSQLVLMSLAPGEEIGSEVHKVDQFVFITRGKGKVVLAGVEERVEKGTVVCVPAFMQHNVINSDESPMKLYTVYAPPQHIPGAVHETKAEAEAAEREAFEPVLATDRT